MSSARASSRPNSSAPRSGSSTARPTSAIPGANKSDVKSDTPLGQGRQRPYTAGSVRSESMCSDESDFVGGHRMEALLQALHHEREAGGFFKKFINRSASKVLLKQNLKIKKSHMLRTLNAKQ